MSDFTLESLAEEMSAESAQDDARDDENAQPEGEAQSDEQDDTGEQQEPTEDEGADAEESEEGEDDQPDPESSQDRVHKWKTADGTEYEVPESDLRAGYMREQDYRQKTQTLAKEREQAESEIQKRALQSVQTMNLYGEKLGELHLVRATVAHLESALQQTNREDDPVKYATLQSDLLRAQQQGKDLTGMLSQANQLMQAQQAEQTRKAQGETAKLLAAEMPDFAARLPVWNKHATGTYGFSPEELSQVTDPRIFRLLDDATRFRDLQTRKPEAVKKAQAAPAKPARQTRSVPPSTVDKALKSFNAKPSIEAMAALMSAAK
ncbi:hypothetical protein LMG2828_04709 [Achromobacter piechaudii]|uniref:hypothetical protein n=1 Tax=Achromobacter piechaudii TaxID=72556 RepID=UPI0014656312|nr:hypothetical protein [Achromobacter piechaudii]CAB3905158.1 hypothetical protein LMG2828_04709 [Achromobacter piechaudii]